MRAVFHREAIIFEAYGFETEFGKILNESREILKFFRRNFRLINEINDTGEIGRLVEDKTFFVQEETLLFGWRAIQGIGFPFGYENTESILSFDIQPDGREAGKLFHQTCSHFFSRIESGIPFRHEPEIRACERHENVSLP